MTPALRIRNLSKTFGGVRALDAVDFEVGEGEVHCLAGENGCGKSTLIKLVTGVHRPEPGGSIEVFGQAHDRMTPDLARRLGIAVIWQDLALFPEMGVAENIAFETLLGRPRPVARGRIEATARAALDRLGVRLDLGARLRALPIAERQLVAVARALVADARLLFMDEPTASLTRSETDRLLDVVRGLSARGVAVVFVSHRLQEVLDVCEAATVLRDGRLVGRFPTAGMSPRALGELMTGQSLDAGVSARAVAAPPVLEVEGLTRRGEFEDVSLTVRAGEVVALTGLIGAGRTELGLALFGMTRPQRGAVRLGGRPVAFRSNREALAAGVAYVSEDRLSLGLVQPQSIEDNAVVAVLRRLTGPSGLLSRRRRDDLVGGWVRDLAIKVGHPADPVSTLSGGNQQRVVLAKWLAAEPRLLILDSPTVGVDVGARAGIFRIVRALADRGLAILMITDEVPEAHAHADRVLHMRGGRIVAEWDPRTVAIPAMEEAVYA